MPLARILVALGVALAIPSAGFAAEEFSAAAHAAVVAPYLDEQTVAVAHVDLTRLNLAGIRDLVAAATDAGEDQRAMYAAMEEAAKGEIARYTDAGIRDLYWVVSTADVPHSNPFLLVPLREGSDEQEIIEVLAPGQRPDGMSGDVAERIGDVIFFGGRDALARLRSRRPDPRPALVPAFEAAGTIAAEGEEPRATSAQVLVLLSDLHRRVLREALPTLPRELGGGTGEGLARGFNWAALGVDLSESPAVQLTFQSEDARAAEQFRDLLNNLLKSIGGMPEVREVAPRADRAAELLRFGTRDDRVVLTVTDGKRLTEIVGALIVPPVRDARETANAAATKNNLKQLGIAMHNYHEVHNTFPPAATADADGKKLLSWRVYLLPWLDEEELFAEFHLSEPWDSEHNRKLISRMPDVYRAPAAGDLGEVKTVFLVPVGEVTMFPPTRAAKYADVVDGLSNTVMIVEAADEAAVTWTRPDDLEIDPEKPVAGLFGEKEEGVFAVSGDGAVRFIPKSIDPAKLRALFTRAGKDIVDDF